MITIRNKDTALAVAARAGTTGLVPGQLVKLAQGAAVNGQPYAVAPIVGDYSGSTLLGIVDWADQDSQTTDFGVDFVNGNAPLTTAALTIPQFAQVTVYLGTLVIGYSKDVLPTTLKAVREGTACGYDLATHLPAVAGDSERVNAVMYRVDNGAEYTIIVKL